MDNVACGHPAQRPNGWRDYEGGWCVGCTKCGEILLGEATLDDDDDRVVVPLRANPDPQALDIEVPEWVNFGGEEYGLHYPPPERGNPGGAPGVMNELALRAGSRFTVAFGDDPRLRTGGLGSVSLLSLFQRYSVRFSSASVVVAPAR